MKRQSFSRGSVLLFFCFFFFHAGFSQVIAKTDEVRLPAAQDWNFIRYGNVPVNPYTGTLSLSIPLYRYTDPDFDLELSAGYAAEGFKPNQPGGILGLGWHLNAGGCVTREVRGVSDWFSARYNNNRGYGHYFFNRYNDVLSTALNDYNRNLPPFLYLRGNTRYETQSDIYHFNFGKHKGSFVLGPDGKIHTFGTDSPSGEYRIDLFLHPDSSDFLKIVIKTGDGYEYTFGDSPQLKFHSTKNSPSEVPYYDQEELPKLSWPLTQIQAPNRRTVTFKYTDAETYWFVRPEIDVYDRNNDATNTSPSYSYRQFRQVYTYQYPSLPGADPNPSYNRQSLLEQIRIDNNIQIEFTYEARQPEQYRWVKIDIGNLSLQPISALLNSSRFLQAISVKQTAFTATPVELKTCRFDYHYAASGNPILFLDAITLSGEGKYTMNYYDAAGYFPYQGTIAQDVWGFYTNTERFNSDRGMYTPIGNNINNMSIYNIYGAHLLGQSPNLDGTRKGMLSSLTYPTGGSTGFEYELHRCSRTLARNGYAPTFPLTPQFLTACDEQDIGGLRIRKITDYAASGEAASFREFLYESAGKSTGTSLNFPFYINTFQPNTRGDFTNIPSDLIGGIGSGDDPAESEEQKFVREINRMNYSPDKSHIEYSCVQERHADGAIVEYRYSHYGNMPDVNDSISVVRRMQNTPLPPGNSCKPFSRHTQRGKLLSKHFFDASGRPLQKETHVYDTTLTLPFIEGIEADEYALYIYRTYTGEYPLVRTLRTDYAGTDSIETVTDFSYNFRQQLTRSATTNSDGSVKGIETTYLPPREELEEGTWQYHMATCNSVRNPLAREVFQGPSAAESRLLAREEFTYLWYKSLFKPVLIRQTACDGPTPMVRDYTFKYNHSGNVVETTSPEGRATSYVWGYAGLFLLAKVENATITTVIERAIPLPLTVETVSGALNETQKDALRNLPGTLATLFDHRPFVGVSRIETPDGTRTHYTYDAFGHLTKVADRNQQPERTLEYRIKNQ